MATFVDDEEELWQSCPFDAKHIISKRRYGIHLLKCPERNRRGFKMCPYNARHHIETHLFEKHISECDDRHQFERSAYEEYLFKAQNDGKCFIYGETEKKKSEVVNETDFEDVKVPEEEDYTKLVVPGLQEKVIVEELADRLEDCNIMPSFYAVQRLPKVSRRKLHQLILAMKKTKEIEDDTNNYSDKSESGEFFESWNLNDMNKVVDKQKTETEVQLNIF